MKFCLDAAWLKGATFMGIFNDPQGKQLTSVSELDDMTLRLYLEAQAKTDKSNTDVATLDKQVKKKLCMNMNNDSIESRMFNLFIDCYTILEKLDCEWVSTDAPRVAVKHILQAIRPVGLKDIIKSDLRRAHLNLKENFLGFRDHCVNLAKTCRYIETKKAPIGATSDSESDDEDGETDTPVEPKKKKRKVPPCPHSECEKEHKGPKRNHYIKDCPKFKNNSDRQVLFDKLKELKATPGPSGGTRRQQTRTLVV
ncbi:unnamed protein product [Agarophyton chilense]